MRLINKIVCLITGHRFENHRSCTRCQYIKKALLIVLLFMSCSKEKLTETKQQRQVMTDEFRYEVIKCKYYSSKEPHPDWFLCLDDEGNILCYGP